MTQVHSASRGDGGCNSFARARVLPGETRGPMPSRTLRRIALLVAATAAGAVVAVTASDTRAGSKDEELRELQDRLGDKDLVGDWIYDDVDEAFTVSKRTGKPIFLVFR